MDWIRVCDGYVRRDAIIDVHTNQVYPGIVYVTLVNGDSVKYKDFGGDKRSAEVAIDELMDYLMGRQIDVRELY